MDSVESNLLQVVERFPNGADGEYQGKMRPDVPATKAAMDLLGLLYVAEKRNEQVVAMGVRRRCGIGGWRAYVRVGREEW